MKVCVLPSDMDGPGCYRVLFPMRQMVEQGKHTVVMPPGEIQDEGGRKKMEFTITLDPPSPFADIYVLQQRKERMWPEYGVSALRQSGIITVAEIDDNYLELPFWNPAFRGAHPYLRNDGSILDRQTRRRLRREVDFPIETNMHNHVHMHDMFRQVDALTVSTPYLAELYSRYNSNVKLLRNYLDWDIWGDIEPQYQVDRPRTRIGYLGVFNYRQGDLEVIREVIPKFMKDHPEVDFVANSLEVHDFLGVPYSQRVTEPEYAFWPGEGEYPVGRKTAVLDVGLVPMASNVFNEGKSHLKGMEYNAAGVPFVASPADSYKNYWCEHGKNGFLAESPGDWLDYLDVLVRNDSTRRVMGTWAREKAKMNTIQEHWTKWEKFYLGLIGGTEERISRAAITRGAVQKVSEFAELLRLLHDKKLSTIVEIGSAKGGTFWALGHIAADDALLVSIDIPAGSEIDVREGKDVYGSRNRERMKTYKRANQKVALIDASSQLDCTRDNLKEILGDRRIDVLLIDADHTYKGVKRDYELYAPLVADDGVIVFHDIAHHLDKRVGVERLWKQLRTKHRVVEFVSPEETWGYQPWGGIGVILNGRSAA